MKKLIDLAKFPDFENVDIAHSKALNELLICFPPYSDFNFISLWSWNTDETTQISVLNDNLVIKLESYSGEGHVYSILGSSRLNESVKIILDFLSHTEAEVALKLVPHDVAAQLDDNQYVITEDIDNNDYILDVERLTTFGGNKLGAKRNFINRFTSSYVCEIKEFENISDDLYDDVNNLLASWKKISHGRDNEGIDKEDVAIKKLLKASDALPFTVLCAYIDKELAGFSLIEKVGEFGIVHFIKADYSQFTGIYPYLLQQTSIWLSQNGCKYINYEQDLGIEGMRKNKKSYMPIDYLKKFIVTIK